MLSNAPKFLRSALGDLLTSFFLREFIIFCFSTVFLQVVRFAVALIAAKSLGPTTWGIWQILYLIIAYSSVAHLGVINGMNREIPFFKGKGDEQQVSLIREVAFGMVLVSSLLAGLIILALSLASERAAHITPLKWMSLLFTLYLLHQYLQVYLKSHRLFHFLSLQQIFFGLAFPICAVPLLMGFQLSGYVVGQSIAILLTCLFILKTSAVRLMFRLDVRETVRLLRIGAPIMLAGILYALMITVDRLVISTFLSIQQLGYYSLSIMVMGSLTLIPMVVGQQTYPRMAETWGRTSKSHSLSKWIRFQVLMSMLLTAPLIVGAYVFLPPFVNRFMVEYTPGITAMKITMLVPLFLGLLSAFGNFLNVVDKQAYLLLFQVLAVFINITLNVMFVRMGLGINGVAIGTTAAFIFHSAVLAVFGTVVLRKLDRKRNIIPIKTDTYDFPSFSSAN